VGIWQVSTGYHGKQIKKNNVGHLVKWNACKYFKGFYGSLSPFLMPN
jgi:hypothetical protein